MTAKLVDTAAPTYTPPTVWDDAEKWEPAQKSSTTPVAPPVHASRDPGSENAPARVAVPPAGDAGKSILASLWLGLFVAYTATVLPLVVWAMASMAS